MKRTALVALVLALVATAFLVGRGRGRDSAIGQSPGGRKVAYYVDPMNPAHTSDRPGLAPCGMEMEPVYADEAGTAAPADGNPLLPGTVKVNVQRQQLIGLRMGVVEKKPLQFTLRLFGRVAADETRIYRIIAAVDGWVTKTLPFAAGSPVKKDEALATFYSPEFLAAGQALLFALNSRDRVQAADTEDPTASSRVNQFNLNIQQYRDSLRNLGMSEAQIEEMVRTRKFTQDVNIVSPVDGVVAARNLSGGQRFQKGTELYRIVDLSQVWILADVFEQDAGVVQPDATVRVSLPNGGKTVKATLSAALPEFDASTRTLKLRFEGDNPGLMLKPDMFVDVELSASLPETLVIPADALLDAGLSKTVFVNRGNGYFEPRIVQIGEQRGSEVQILQGLMAGERVVVSGNFLLDSESRMRLAARGVRGTQVVNKDPVCGMVVDEVKARAANRTYDYGGKTYLFCNDGCKAEFVADPEKFLRPAAPAGQNAPTTPPVASTNASSLRDQPPH